MTGSPSRGEAAHLTALLDGPSAQPDAVVLAALAAPIDPAAAMRTDELDKLLDPTPCAAENGWCWTEEQVAYVAVRTPLPGNTAEMWDWWFDWHPRRTLRYRLWCPDAHFGNRLVAPPARGAKPFWGARHFADEDIGVGRELVRIDFLAPSKYGFSTDALEDPRVGTIVGGYVGSGSRHVRLGVMTHVFLVHEDGLILRSRFWLGGSLRPDLPGALGDLTGRLINRARVRRRVLPRRLPKALAHHCAHEYARLGALLPELYASYGRIAG